MTERWQRIAPDVRLGDDVRIADFVNLYGCSIGAHSRVGPFVEIQRGAVIGERVKVQSHSFICEGVTIEDDVFIGHGVMFINDSFPRTELPPGVSEFAAEKVLIKRGASIGSSATILGGITIGERAMVGAGAVVTRDVPDRTVVAGNPARILRTIDDNL
jgi:acetyltransferase-like isoleucine patch superfamily enzyme